MWVPREVWEQLRNDLSEAKHLLQDMQSSYRNLVDRVMTTAGVAAPVGPVAPVAGPAAPPVSLEDGARVPTWDECSTELERLERAEKENEPS